MRLFSNRQGASAASPPWPVPMQLEASYAVCRSISRAAARNFYYAFLALPREKRDAICAVYAFMRHADDISDQPGAGKGERREKLADWLNRLRLVTTGEEATDDPVLLAVADAQRRYEIPFRHLETLVSGTAMDLEDETAETPAIAAGRCAADANSPAAAAGAAAAVQTQNGLTARYRSFAELYDYCYHVASVVGLICIRIFGYHDPAAEGLAERCGIAFQLTNIIRDVGEDAAMGRVYLPQEDLERCQCNLAGLGSGATPEVLAEHFRPLLEFECARAREYYLSAEALLPLIDEDSQPALWVLVTIYRRLLEKIAARNCDVFTQRVRLTMPEKLRVLAKGLWLRLV
jgi:phytoene synthase